MIKEELQTRPRQRPPTHLLVEDLEEEGWLSYQANEINESDQAIFRVSASDNNISSPHHL